MASDAASTVAPLLADPESVLAAPGMAVWKHGPTRSLGRVVVAGKPLFVKVFHAPSFWHRLGWRLAGSPARRGWTSARRLSERGVRVPVVLGAAEVNGRRGRRSACLVTAELTGDSPAVYWQRQLTRVSVQRRREFLRALGRFVRSLHDMGVYSSDLKEGNILVAADGDVWVFGLVDLEVVRFPRRVSWRRRRKNLVQLDRTLGRVLSRTQRLSTLRAYQGSTPPGRLVRRLLRARVMKDREYERRCGPGAGGLRVPAGAEREEQ